MCIRDSYYCVTFLSVILPVTIALIPKVAVSGYTMTIIRKPYRHRSTAICFHCTISLKSSGFDNCMSGFRSYGGVYCWCSCCPATFLFSGYAPAVSGLPTVGLSAVVDPATYIYPCRLSFQPSLRLFFRLLSTVTFSTTCGSILGQRRRNRGGNGCAEGARSPLQSAGRKYLRPRNNMPSLSAG